MEFIVKKYISIAFLKFVPQHVLGIKMRQVDQSYILVLKEVTNMVVLYVLVWIADKNRIIGTKVRGRNGSLGKRSKNDGYNSANFTHKEWTYVYCSNLY